MLQRAGAKTYPARRRFDATLASLRTHGGAEITPAWRQFDASFSAKLFKDNYDPRSFSYFTAIEQKMG